MIADIHPLALVSTFALLLGLSCPSQAHAADEPSNYILSYTKSAQDWEKEALPIGNGRLGGMVFGGVTKEHIQFNEDSLWFGDEENTGSYQPFGDVYVELGHESPTDYRRELDISRAIHSISYQSKGINYTREYFSSHPSQVMVFRFFADKPGAYTGKLTLTDAHKAVISSEGNRIKASGSLKGCTYEKHGTHQKGVYELYLDYEAQLLVLHSGGTLTTGDGDISFENCDSLTILLAADTNYLNQRDKGWKGPHPHERISAQLNAAAGQSYEALKQEHVEDYQGLFCRLTLDLGVTPEAIQSKSTAERMKLYRSGAPDTDIEELMFQYARYLMISCSRPGAMPANLQGLWNQSNNPPWHCGNHTDVNIEMNYWFADRANLSECFLPFSEWVHNSREVWKERTKKTFNTRGWAMHPSNGIFGGQTNYAWLMGDSAWLAQNLYDHYAHTLDEEYLRTRAYPVMKELCELWEDRLIELPDGRLVSPDGYSPEHGPREDGVSYDQQLIWDLFTNFIETSEVLGVDEEFRKKVVSMKARLLGPRIGKWGQLQEWMIDRDTKTDRHRHLSHLIAVHPGRQISPLTTPELSEAAKVSMNARGDGESGWSKAWKINIWARLHDGNRAYKLLSEMLRRNVLDNLFGSCPPFQIDGNFGYASGVCEMLMQSHMGHIHLLPALPDAWPNGSIRGMRARGGFEVDMQWEAGILRMAAIRSDKGTMCKVRTTVPVTVMNRGRKIMTDEIEKGIITFRTEEDQEYVIVPEGIQE
jgi:alpha-L-fucosidase 2